MLSNKDTWINLPRIKSLERKVVKGVAEALGSFLSCSYNVFHICVEGDYPSSFTFGYVFGHWFTEHSCLFMIRLINWSKISRMILLCSHKGMLLLLALSMPTEMWCLKLHSCHYLEWLQNFSSSFLQPWYKERRLFWFLSKSFWRTKSKFFITRILRRFQ